MSTGREGGESREGREERDGREGFRWILDPESSIQDPPGFFGPGSRVQDPDPGASFCCWTLPSSHLVACFILPATLFTSFHFSLLSLNLFLAEKLHLSPMSLLPFELLFSQRMLATPQNCQNLRSTHYFDQHRSSTESLNNAGENCMEVKSR